MTGGEYANLIACYVSKRFGSRGLKVYREIHVGKTIIGKNRRIDVFRALPMAGCIAYAGTGFSEGVRYMLEASPHAAYCMPLPEQADSTTDTRELDHLLSTYFGWWDVLVGNRKPV